MTQPDVKLSRAAASQAVADLGWRYLLGTLVASVPVASLAEAARLAALAIDACEGSADGHLRLDLRPDRLELSLQARALGLVTARDTALADQITRALVAAGSRPAGGTAAGEQAAGGQAAAGTRPVQMLEIAIDAMDIPAIRPFWKAVLGYAEEPGHEGPEEALVDPAGQLPAVWFQQMDEPRPQRNRIHLDVTVAHDEAPARVRAALAAGGTLVSDARARAFWVLADAEGNEACVCTWQDRDQDAPVT